MKFSEFVSTYYGKATDYDGGAGVQCVDLIKLYLDKCFDIKPRAIGNAESYWNKFHDVDYLYNNFIQIPNTPEFIPQKRRYLLLDW